ncbi:hypothetical protein D9Q98_003850 [Chlorella vulgaris]|uniref:PUB domain-containing protein n=1 Tax=Chlorella vulgaris TaxID=3077 RepID=A0A9D4TQV7_CHLVU|nr:hypothetical protein D9Q98_003850 [Chlorella vulgaris]
MGYAGYFSTTARIKDKRSPLESALIDVADLATLELLEKITYNVVVQPGEEKYRRLKLSNAKIRSSIADAEGGLGAMRELGWRLGEDEGQEVLTLAKGLATMAQVRAIQEAQQQWKKKSAKDLVQKTKAVAGLPGTQEQEELRRQLEADRAERAQREPVTKGSMAQPLPGAGAGPNMTTAAEAGLTGGGCC